jgi:MtN3 and saliva related transmembrane protein
MTETIGLIAGLCTSISFIPQVIRTIRTHDTSGISLYMYVIFIIGVVFWLAFGIMIKSPAVIYTNSATIIFSGIILFIKIRNLIKKRHEKAAGGE